MSNQVENPSQVSFLQSPAGWLLMLAGVLGLLIFGFHSGLDLMVQWWEKEEYSHGYMIPMVALFLLWQRAPRLAAADLRPSWGGVLLMLVAMAVWLLGELSALYTLVQYAFWLALVALCLALTGMAGLRVLWVPLVYLVFMIPLPNFLFFALSAKLQLISSWLGAEFLRLVGISVFLEGNVIDLGGYSLQVVEACSGLRYLFPLMSFGFLVAYLYRAPVWQRAVLFLSTIPITVFMNSFRIAFIGVTVERWGSEMAEGFLHDFEGWTVFMGCLGLLMLEAWLFHVLGRHGVTVLSRIDLDLPPLSAFAGVAERVAWHRAPSFLLAVAMVAAVYPVISATASREEVVPPRTSLNQFPLAVGEWHGVETAIAPDVLDTLKLTDYVNAAYVRPGDRIPVSFYVAYYDSQRKGASVHSPRSCLPGGGWEMVNLEQVELPQQVNGQPLRVNRVIIRHGEEAQLVYYWFQQRGRVITNEYALKWLLFQDSLTKGRTDGSLVRLVTPVPPGGEAQADERLKAFVNEVNGLLPAYVPN